MKTCVLKDRRKRMLWAQELRRVQTEHEKILWEYVQDRRFENLKFRRQVAIGRFIADCYCHQLRLILEVDGNVHDDQKEYDQERDEYLREHGYTVMRCTNDELEQCPEIILARISKTIFHQKQ